MDTIECSNLPGPAIGAITAMLDRREKALALINQAMDLIAEAQVVAPDYALQSTLRGKMRWYPCDLANDKEGLRKALDRGCWEHLLEQTKLGAVLNHAQLQAVRKDIALLAPELTRDRVMSTFMDFYVTKEDTFRQGLIDVFRALSGNFKSHDAFKIGDRLILAGALSSYGWAAFGRHKDRLNDLWRYLCLLDDIDPTEVAYEDLPSTVIGQHHRGEKAEYEFDQFRVKTHMNGNIHIWLDKRPDLVEKVNNLIAEYYGEVLPG